MRVLHVDTGNIYKSLIKTGRKLDYKKYIDACGKLDNATAYGSMHPGSRLFIRALRGLHMNTVFAPVCYTMMGDIDVDSSSYHATMATQILLNDEDVDTLILGTNSVDFLPLIQDAVSEGIEVIIIASDIPPSFQNTGAQCIELTEEFTYSSAKQGP